MWIIQLDYDCWSTYSRVDPESRTLVESSARRFKNRKKAEKTLAKISQFRTFRNAEIINIR